ncbi:MAG TPA: methionyl-tRNA formyltransferase [Candidatus Binataceae bacterium]|nr:methionyl-tRNA formyltransferase [Candidatus Binataceae bacterium]
MASHPPQSASDASRPPLRIVFMGTPALAARILERMLAAPSPNFTIVAVVTRPDQPRKRGLKLEPSEVAAVAARHNLTTLKPVKIRTPEFLAELKSFEPDLLAIAAYGRILPNPILEAPRLMPINVHASLLPRHRGASPVEGAILAGDTETGVTIMRVTEQMDAGPILLQRSIPIEPDDTQGSLKEKLADLGADALLEALDLLHRGVLHDTPQDANAATYTSPITREHSVIDWHDDAVRIERMTRAYDPWPVARTTLGGDDMLVWRARVDGPADAPEAADAPPGTIVALKPVPLVKCGAGVLALLELQAAGRRRMPAAEFFRGRRVPVGTRLGPE